MRLRQVTAHDQDAILGFETANRAFFAASLEDRGDAYFADYPARHAIIMALQAAGTDLFHVLVDDDGSIMGRFNLVDIAGGHAELGYRVGERFTGRGVATRGAHLTCERARTVYGLVHLRAVTDVDNVASQAVLLRNGFTLTETSTIDGRPSRRFDRPLRDPPGAATGSSGNPVAGAL